MAIYQQDALDVSMKGPVGGEAGDQLVKSGRSRTSLMTVWEKTFLVALLVILWELLPWRGYVDPFLLPPFDSVAQALGAMVLSGEMARHLTASLARAGIGFLAAAGFAVPLGFLMGRNRSFASIADPLLQACRNTSTLALYPVFILFFGLGEVSKIAVILWGATWPILLNTISGVANVDASLIKLARSMGVSPVTMFRKVIFPLALPSILAGLRLSAATALLLLVAAEMLGADSGLGFMIFYYEERYAIPQMFAGILSIALLGVLVNDLLVRLEKRLTFWREKSVKA